MNERTDKDDKIDMAISELIKDSTESFFLITAQSNGTLTNVRYETEKEIYESDMPPANLMMLYGHCHLSKEMVNEVSDEPFVFEDVLDGLYSAHMHVDMDSEVLDGND